MFVNHNPSAAKTLRGRPPRRGEPEKSNLAVARRTWGESIPGWVTLLATACDSSSQAEAARVIGKSSGYVSRLINNCYPGDMAEAERLVRAAFGGEDVLCPLWGPIPLPSCMRNRRRSGPASNSVERMYAAACPSCPVNSDINHEEA